VAGESVVVKGGNGDMPDVQLLTDLQVPVPSLERHLSPIAARADEIRARAANEESSEDFMVGFVDKVVERLLKIVERVQRFENY
jgi:hypothetical protein